MKLALFHTIFNVVGVLLVSPFIRQLVHYLETLFCTKEEGRGQAVLEEAKELSGNKEDEEEGDDETRELKPSERRALINPERAAASALPASSKRVSRTAARASAM